MPRTPIPIETRFWSKVQKTDGCWIWTASVEGGGYGYIGRGRRGQGNEKAHRLSWMIHYGPIPDGLEVCHSCDVRRCVRPDHLFLGAHKANIRDCIQKGRFVWNRAHGEDHKNSKLTTEQVRFARSYASSHTRSIPELARKIGVCPGTLRNAVTGKTWKHV